MQEIRIQILKNNFNAPLPYIQKFIAKFLLSVITKTEKKRITCL